MDNEKWYQQFGWISLVLFVASIVLITTSEVINAVYPGYKDSLYTFILNEIGVAGLIALFLNLSVEWYNRARHSKHQTKLLTALDNKYQTASSALVKEVNKAVFKTVYERNVDPAAFEQVDKHLLRADTMRRNFKLLFSLKPFLDAGQKTDYIELSLRNTYDVHNLTDNSVTVPVINALVDITPEYKSQCHFIRLKIGDQPDKTGEELKHLVGEPPGGKFITLVQEATIPANGHIPVMVEYKKLAPKHYNEIMITTIAMDGIKMTAIDSQEHFDFDAISLHPDNVIDNTIFGNKDSYEWVLDKPILPGQGIVLMWHPREVPTGAAAN